MVQIYHRVPFDEFFIPYTTTVSLNWKGMGEVWEGVLLPVRAGGTIAPGGLGVGGGQAALTGQTTIASGGQTIMSGINGVGGNAGVLGGNAGVVGGGLGATTGGEELVLNPKFEEHLMDLNNWSLGSAFARAHPALAGTVKIRDP